MGVHITLAERCQNKVSFARFTESLGSWWDEHAQTVGIILKYAPTWVCKNIPTVPVRHKINEANNLD
ncbi:hypothetical protein MGMO_128c00200 [Methyloglobulus morosus KoM1]|uniref:Uncharacterized protein n=1 Tax=Methyloglobulus morosus KoM1 TaxID=1116472 RepID=V5BPR7_9GAMM|nr:hypothetical protein MGMO_128c00200 [Methyloglobulus morosus KoM1]